MGKKRSNRNKRKKNGNKILQNPCDEQKSKSVFDEGEEKGKNSSKNYSYLGAQKEPLDSQLPNHNLSFKTVSSILKSNPSVSLSENNSNNCSQKYKSLNTEGIKTQSYGGTLQNSYTTNIYPVSHGDKHNILYEETCNASVNKPRNGNQNSSLTDMNRVKSVSITPYEWPEPSLKDEFPVSLTCLSESDEEYPISYFSAKKSVESRKMKPKSSFQSDKLNSLHKEFNNKLTLCRYPIEESLGSDEEYSTSDFFQPVFDDYEFKSKTCFKENVDGVKDANSYYEENIWSPGASYSGFRNSSEKCDFEGKELKESFSNSVVAYKSSKDSFKDVYHNWLPERRNTLQKLRALYTEIHNVQLNYNKSQAACREFSCVSRAVKNEVENQAVNFLASFTAFLGDAASGIVSVAQAFNVEIYQSKFQEIMKHDAEITQRLYKARSQCIGKYQDIEEVMRKFHFDTFSSTVNKISNTLEVGKYWEAMKNAYGKDDMPQLMDVVSKFFDNAFQSTKLEEVSDSIQSYADDNPAALNACKSAGRATYGALDTCVLNHSQNHLLRGVRCTTNQMLMIGDKCEVERLRSSIEEEDSPQSKLESQIEDAIDSLESDMREINDIYFELFKIHVDSDDSDCDLFAYY